MALSLAKFNPSMMSETRLLQRKASPLSRRSSGPEKGI